VHRYVTDKPYDRWLAAATFFVAGAPEVRGIVTLHPRLLECHVGKSSDPVVEHPCFTRDISYDQK